MPSSIPIPCPRLSKERCLFEKIEDEYDVALGQDAYAEYLSSGKQSRPIGELWEECGL